MQQLAEKYTLKWYVSNIQDYSTNLLLYKLNTTLIPTSFFTECRVCGNLMIRHSTNASGLSSHIGRITTSLKVYDWIQYLRKVRGPILAQKKAKMQC